MKYSIIIPTYNHCDDFLKPCIKSILKNTDLDLIQIIVSANGCTDNTREYLDELSVQLPPRDLLEPTMMPFHSLNASTFSFSITTVWS